MSAVRAAVVGHASTATAEVLAKAAVVAGPNRGAQFVTENDAHGWFLLDSGTMVRVG